MIFAVKDTQNIFEKHTDGGCYKLTIVYTDFEDSVSFAPHIVYAEDFMDLINYGLKVQIYLEESGKYVIDFRIQDDSK